MSIIVKNLSHIYSKNGPFERTAISDVSFEIDDGEFIGLIGHTGSGKSTLIEHLNGLLKPSGGQIIIDGEDITQGGCNLNKIRSKVGLVFQYPEYQLFEETVYKDIAYGPSNMNLTDDEIKRRVYDALAFVGLEPETLEKSPFDLSGGQKRRVAIAGVLAMEPSVLILDEPTAGLDPVGRNDLLMRLKRMHEEKKITIILVSHSMEDIADTVDKVMVMADGKLKTFGKVNEVFSQSEMLEKIGLDIPQVCSVMRYFKEQGYEIDSNIYNVDKAADAIFKMIKGAQNA